jgi:putative DNA methylase
VLGAGFVVVNSQPVKAEMSVGTPKSQAKEPIQLDIIVVCRKRVPTERQQPLTVEQALESAKAKLRRIREAGFRLSRNDRKITLFGQLLATLRSTADTRNITELVERELGRMGKEDSPPPKSKQLSFLEDV